jgi:hypothetical protein
MPGETGFSEFRRLAVPAVPVHCVVCLISSRDCVSVAWLHHRSHDHAARLHGSLLTALVLRRYETSYDLYGFGLTTAHAVMLRDPGAGGDPDWNVIKDSDAFRGHLVAQARRVLEGRLPTRYREGPAFDPLKGFSYTLTWCHRLV